MWGRIVTISSRCIVTGGAAHTAFNIATLPEKARPAKEIFCAAYCADGAGNRHGVSVQVKPNGQLHFVAGIAFVEGGFLATYIV